MSLANGYSQNILKHAPQGFDSLDTEIPHGKIDTITYSLQPLAPAAERLSIHLPAIPIK